MVFFMVDSVENIGLGLWNAHWLDFLLRGLIAIAFGLILFFFPGISLATFIMLFAAFAFVVGIISLIQAVTIKDGRWWVRIIEGLIGIAAAAAVVMWPGLTLLMFALIIAFYWIFTGILDVIVAIEARKIIQGEWLLIAGGILSVIVGAILLAYPMQGIVALAQVIGIFNVAFGILMVILAIKLKLTPARAPSAV
jgi:uncharacterized membrane protein HdeD (DUF308 family)